MAIAPPNLSSRLKGIFQEEPDIAVNHLGELIEETFALVEKHMPEVDTTNAKKRYTLWSDKFYNLEHQASQNLTFKRPLANVRFYQSLFPVPCCLFPTSARSLKNHQKTQLSL